MIWSELYNSDNQPNLKQVEVFVKSPLWAELNDYLQTEYGSKPELHHSKCTMDKGFWKGWHIKYKKSGKALCTLYPREGYFSVNVVVGPKQENEADHIALFFCDYMQKLYRETPMHPRMGKWLTPVVTDKEILEDVKKIIEMRIKTKS